MLALSTAVFALVLVVVALGALGLLMSHVAALTRALASLSTRTALIEQTTSKSAPAALAAGLEDLRGALGVMAASNRKQFGSLWARVGRQREPEYRDGQPVDEEMGDLLAFQSAAPVRPNGA